MFYKIYENKSPQYLFKLTPEKTHAHEYAIRNIDTIPCFKVRHNFFKNSFFPSTIIECEQFRSYLQELKKFCCFQKLFKYSKYLIKKKRYSFLTQQLNIFHVLKDSKSLLFSKFPLESLNSFRSFFKLLIIFTSYLFSQIFLFIILVPSTLEFWCLVTVNFKFTVLYNNIYRKKN